MRLNVLQTSLFALIALFTVALIGCGGGSSKSARGTGRATITIVWDTAGRAAKSRLIPLAANSIRISILDGNTSLASQIVPRPATGNSTTQEFTELPVRSLTLSVAAYASNDGTGTALAVSNDTLNVTASTTVEKTLTLASTIDHLAVSYAQATVLKDEVVGVTATAFDADGNTVLLTPSALTWSSSEVTKVKVDVTNTGANLTGIGAGTVSVIVTDTESNLSKEFSVTGMTFALTPASQTLSVSDTQAFSASIAGPNDTSVTWSIVDADGNATTHGGTINANGLYTAPASRGSFKVKATSNADPMRALTADVAVQSGDAHLNIH
jgi:hypothetical protein